MVPPVNMTRSFINPKDRMAEVARRRQEAESELRRRREERLRQLEERSENALKRKQMGLQEKLSKNKTEADHLKEVNKRRLEKETLEKQRIQQLLEKKRSPPRNSQATTKPKAVVAFGSSVPRRLDISKESSNRSASSSSVNGTLNTTTNSLMTRSLHPALSPPAKERPTLRSNVRPPIKQQPAFSKPPIKPLSNRLPPAKPTSSPRKPAENRMTRSVHPELCPTPNKRILDMSKNPKPIMPKRTVQSKVEPKLKKKEENEVVPNIVIANGSAVSKSTDSGICEPVEKIEDNAIVDLAEEPKAVFNESTEEPKAVFDEPPLKVEETPIIDLGDDNFEPEVDETKVEEPMPQVNDFVELKVEEPIPQTNDLVELKVEEPIPQANDFVEPIPQTNDFVELKVEEPIPQANDFIEPEVDETVTQANDFVDEENEKPANTEFGQIFDVGANDETPESVPQSDYVHNRSSSDDRDSTRTRTLTPQPVFSDQEHTISQNEVLRSAELNEEQESPIVDEPTKTNHLFLLNTNNDSDTIATPTLDSISNDDQKVDNNNQVTSLFSSNQVPSDPEQTSPQKESSNNNHTLPSAGDRVVIGLTEKLQQERDNRRAKLNEILSRTREQSNSASPVKTNESDPSALARSLLARRSERLNESAKSNDGSSSPPNKLSTDSEQKMVSLADEFENLGLSNNKFLLPGQLPDTHHTNNLS